MQKSNVLTYGLLIAVIFVWALAWPISKIGLEDMPPMWFTAFRLWAGFITLFTILFIAKKIKKPNYKDLPLILSIGMLQMACFLLLLNGGLSLVDAGRSAILVYSTPIIVTPIAILFFGERLKLLKLLGLLLGIIGIVILFNPATFDWTNKMVVFGNLLLLLAAACWAGAVLHTRYGTWHSTALELAPWQLLIASIFVLLVCFILNPKPRVNLTPQLIASGLYNGLLATGFAYPAIIYVSQRLPAITTSTLLLGVPVLVLIFSTWWLGEPLTFDKVVALITILSGLALISINNIREK